MVSETGEVVEEGGEISLPALLGSAASVGVEKIPDASPGETQTASLLLFPRVEQSARQPFSPYGLQPNYRSRLGSRLLPGTQQRSVTLLPGVEAVTYEFGSPRGNLVR